MLEATALLYYIELNGIKVFDSASVDTSILSFIKTTPDSKHTFDFAHPKDYDTKANAPLQEYITPQSLLQSSLTKESFIFQDSTNAALKAKIEAIGTPLKEWDISIYRGILTGYNEAFIIDSTKRDEILRNCGNENERQRTSELIKPILRGRDIKRYSYEWAGLWIINTHNGYKDSNNNKIPPIDIADYPALKAHLDTHWDKIAKRTDKGETPYNLRNCAYLEEFEKEKIVYQTLARTGNAFQFDNSSYFVPNSCYIITSNKVNLKYLLGLLNSKMMLYYLDNIFSKLDNTGWQWILSSVEKLPIPQITESNKPLCDEIIKCVDKILEIKACHTEALAEVSKNTESKKDFSPFSKAQNDTSKLESKLDSLVYKLYNLTNDEIEIIKGNNER